MSLLASPVATASAGIGMPPTITVTTVREAAAGDRVAFARIVDAFHRDMIRAAYVVCGDSGLAEDATQAAWEIAWRKLGSLRQPDRVRPWLLAVAVNEARQAWRRGHRRRVVEVSLDCAGGRDWSLGPDSAVNPDAIDRLELVNLLGRLSTQDRTLLALRYVARLDAAEIGSIVRMSPSGVRGHFSRLLGRLRREIIDD
jgi:RNA polymerase sigma factor (sigma-70 family)